MKKIVIIFIFLTIAVSIEMFLYSQVRDDSSLSLNFDTISIIGKVLDEAKKPVPNVKVEILLVPKQILERELNLPESSLQKALVALERMYGAGNSEFARVYSDENGNYTFTGVMKPGVYYIEVKNDENYLPTKIKVNIDSAGEKEFKAPDIILKIRKGPILSKKILKKLEQAREAVKNKKEDKAIKLFKEVLEIEPKYAEGYYNVGILLRSKRKFEEAVINFEEAVNIQKDFKLALKALGDTLLALKKYKRASQYFIQYIETVGKNGTLSKEDMKVYKLIGNCYFALKDSENAHHYLIKYIKANEKNNLVSKADAKIYNTIGNWFYSKKQPEKSVHFYKEAVRLNPEIGPDTYIYLGNSYYLKREFKKAIKMFEDYIKRYPRGKYFNQVKKFKEKIESSLPKTNKT